MGAASILELASSGNASEVVRQMRVRSLWSPYYFAKVVLGYKDLTEGFHLQEMERFVAAWASGQALQVVEWPRGFFKSTCFTIGTNIWGILPWTEEDALYGLDVLGLPEREWMARLALHDQDATNLLAFETDSNAKKKIGEIAWHFEENGIFREIFPEIAYTGQEKRWTDNCLIIRRAGRNQRAEEGTFEAIGVGGALQSRHYTRAWEDDTVGEKAIKSQLVMADTIGWHQRLNGAFEDAADQHRFVVANRWGYADLNSFIRESDPRFMFHTRAAYELQDGQERPTFPERYPMHKLLDIRSRMTDYDFSCQYLNAPTLPGEQEVAAEKFHIYHVEPDGTMICSCGARWRPSQCLRYLVYDPYNAKGAGSKSCPAIISFGTSVDHHTFILEYFIHKGGYDRIYDKLFEYNRRWCPHYFTYEDVGHQNLTAFAIRKIQSASDFTGRRFPPMTGVPTRGQAKELRIREALLPFISKWGKFALRAEHQVLRDQFRTFPHPRLTDDYDLLDAINQPFFHGLVRFPEGEDDSAAQKRSEEEYMSRLGQPYSCVEAPA